MSKLLHGMPFATGLGAVMAYEIGSLVTRRYPTITGLSRRSNHVIGTAVVAILAAHFVTTPDGTL